jgi:hypothetical protein
MAMVSPFAPAPSSIALYQDGDALFWIFGFIVVLTALLFEKRPQLLGGAALRVPRAATGLM